MIWNYRTEIKKKLPNTVWKDFRKMISLDVKLSGIDELVDLSEKKFSKFKDLDDLIKTQNSGRKPPKSNTPIKMKIEGIGPKKRLEISGNVSHVMAELSPNELLELIGRRNDNVIDGDSKVIDGADSDDSI